ncbi:MAG: alanine--glyoxylate aminotransferase family protein [Deltaproteobacteria bacterium]|nr:alanine--glyoxylate aminotransferase family protein [Deltaproteobacteria bacterium]
MKYRLMAPGPTPIPEEVLTEMAKPIKHHRTPWFEGIVKDVQAGLKWLFQTQNDIIVLASSGSGAMEASIINVCQKDDRILVVNGGKFGERFGKIAKGHGISAELIDVEWGQAVDVNIIKEKLAQNDYRAVCVQASETSTGVGHPIQEIAKLTKDLPGTALIVDGITALGVIDLPVDKWGIDFLIGGSQKALMLPPGLACLSVSEKAWKLIEQSNTPKFYFNLQAERKAVHQNTTAWTPTVSLFVGLKKVLELMQAEGLQEMFTRHQQLADGIRKAALASELKLLAPDAPSNAVTAIYSPDGIDSGKIVKRLRDDFNMTIANGQDHLKGKIFRIGHLGYYDLFDMITVWSAVEKTLADLGHSLQLGQGVAAIMNQL